MVVPLSPPVSALPTFDSQREKRPLGKREKKAIRCAWCECAGAIKEQWRGETLDHFPFITGLHRRFIHKISSSIMAHAGSAKIHGGSKHGHAATTMRIQAPTPPATPDDVPQAALDADPVDAVDGKRKKQRKRTSKTKQEEEGEVGEEDEDDGEQVLPLNSSAHIQNQRELALSLDPNATLACGYPDCTFVASPPCLVRASSRASANMRTVVGAPRPHNLN